MFDRTFALVCAAFASVALPQLASAQCGTWETHFNPVGLVGSAFATLSFDDGSGPALYVGGDLVRAGPVAVSRIARWDGSAWHAVGSGLPDRVNDLFVFDGALHAASGNSVRRWSGTTWQQVGAAFNSEVRALAEFDDGSGLALYAGGVFTMNNGQPSDAIARWNGSSWSEVGGGIGLSTTSGTVSAMSAFDDGSGPALYLGGSFNGAGSAASPDLVRWDGASWSAVGAGIEASSQTRVEALMVHDFGSGAVLLIGGVFPSASGITAANVATWNGTSYAALDAGLPNTVYDFEIFPGIAGDELIASGGLATLPFQGTARWNGAAWEPLGGPGATVYSLEVFDAGAGPVLVGVGAFGGAHGTRISGFDGQAWSPLPDGLGLNSSAHAFATFDDGSGPSLFVGGGFTLAGTVAAKYLARWSAGGWSKLPIELNGAVSSLRVWDDGSGPALIAGGYFTLAGSEPAKRIARWDGSSWTSFGSGIGSGSLESVDALEVFDDGSGPQLYAGGNFSIAGGITAVGVTRWDGSNWNALEIGCNGPVQALKSFDDGSGPALYVAGDFTQAGSVPANRIARWDGSAWHALGTGVINGSVTALIVFDAGGGPQLYVGGTYTVVGGIAAPGLARWDGAQWHAVSTNFSPATRLLVADLGTGPDLLVSSGTQLHRRQSGVTWSQIGSMTGFTNALALFDSHNDGMPDVYVGGNFNFVNGTMPSVGIATYRGCAQTAESFCAGDGLAIACPCGNSGEIGHGCENSTLSGGALLSANGLASVSNDSLRLDCSGVPTNTTTLFVQATGQANGGIGSVLGDGLLCISGAVLRLGSPNADGETASVGFGTGSQAISINGQIPQAGATRHYQARYRNVASYCTSATFNQSNGASIVWAP